MSVSLKKSNITLSTVLILRDVGLVRINVHSDTASIQPVMQNQLLYRHLKQSEIFGSVLTGIFTLTSETEAERSSDFHFWFLITLLFQISMLERMFNLQSMF